MSDVDLAIASPPSGVHRLDRIETRLGRFAQTLAVIGVLGMLIAAGATVIDVVMRWIVGAGILALNEIVAEAFAVAIAACIPAGLAGRVNLKIDVLAHFFRSRTVVWLDVLGAALLFFVYAVLAWQIAVYSGKLAADGRTTTILQWPQAPFFFAAAALIGYGALVQGVITLNMIRQTLSAHQAPVAEAIRLAVAAGILLVLVLVVGQYVGVLSTWAQAHVGWTVALVFGAMWVLMLAVVPLAAVMSLAGIVGTTLLTGWTPALSVFATEATGFMTNSQFATLPLFMMMGSFAAVSGMADDLYHLAHVALARFRGGLALATIGGCAGFGALTGSSVAAAATIGRVAIPEMRSRGYSTALATGCCAAGGTLGPIVPPGSGPLILFALLTEASIGRLFVASVGPALLTIGLYIITIMIYVRVAPGSAPRASQFEKEAFAAALRRCAPVAILFAVVMGGLYTGVFTDTESAAVGAFGTFIFAVARGRLGRSQWLSAVSETMGTTAMVYGLIFGAQIFSFFVGMSALTEGAVAFVSDLHWAPMLMMGLILLCYLALGSLMDSFAVMVITVPIVTPLVESLGYDVIWWGIMMMMVIEIGMIHPPFGLNVFVLKSILPDTPLTTIYKGVLPFCAADLVKLAILVMVPAIAMWLPSSMH